MVFPEPVKLQNLSNITKIDAANGKAFAVDREGRLFVWGLGRYKYITPDYGPSLVEGRSLFICMKWGTRQISP